ncbi:MAG: hypothetical protein H0W78_04490 [Planctomycetes bacterium]|nr:hypothetical protein [Planctomycetota bacterium]
MDDVDQMQTATPGSGLAIASLVLGILGLVLLPLAIVALVLGIIALTKGQSKGLAIPGVVLGGLGVLLLPLAIIAAIAIPNLLESRVISNEAAAATSLKSGVFPSQIQFQGGAFVDEDKNGVGENGFITELSGTDAVSDARLSLLPPSWNSAEPLLNGYRFALYLPDGNGAAASRGKITDHSPEAIKERESHWIAYAWPEQWGESGRRAFAVTANGTVLSTKPSATGARPEWNSALSDGWGSPPSAEWVPYRR